MNKVGVKRLCFLLFIYLMTAYEIGVGGEGPSPDPAGENGPVITLAYPGVDCEPCWAFAMAFYTEAFRRIGYEFNMASLPSERALIESNAGRIDGEVSRIGDLNADGAYPNLIRVDEVAAVVEVAAYGRKPVIGLTGWDAMFDRRCRIAYEKGLKLFEKKIPAGYPDNLIQPTMDLVQLCRLLAADRADVGIALPVQIEGVLQREEFRDAGIYKIGALAKVKTYPYLHRKHARLVPELEAAIRAMKADGVYEQILHPKNLRQP
jgi:polar amino acid transport system substrate-binding protein